MESSKAAQPKKRVVPAAARQSVPGRSGVSLSPPIQKKQNETGLPDQLKEGTESLSGYSMDDVNVHYNSSKPAQLNAHAFAQGSDIHLGPDQEKHLPHEVWHVVQQKQGRVKPTQNLNGQPVNDSPQLEDEADLMGQRALSSGNTPLSGVSAQSTEPHHTISVAQRMVMTNKKWEKETKKFGKARSADLLRIDGALMEYNKNADAPPHTKLELLDTILVAIIDWSAKKIDEETGDVKSIRKESIEKLERGVYDEYDVLKGLVDNAMNPQSVDDVFIAANELFRRGQHKLHEFLSWDVTEAHKSAAQGYWKDYRTDAMKLEKQLGNFQGADDALSANAHLATKALREGMRAFRTVSYHHLLIDRGVSEKTDLVQIESRLNGYKDELTGDGAVKKQAGDFIENISETVGSFTHLVGAIGGENNQLEDEEDDGVDFELAETMLDAIDNATTQLGFQGTDGKGNEGMKDYTKAPPAAGENDTRSKGQKDVHNAFSKLAPQSAGDRDIVSGVADIEGAVGGLGTDFMSLMSAYETYKKYKDKTPAPPEFFQAKLQITKTPFSVLANILKLTGGALTAHRAGGNSEGGRDLSKSNFGFTAKDTDVSTDVKMVGDFAGAFTGVLAVVGKIKDLFDFIKTGGGNSAKAKEATFRRDMEAAGNLLNKYADTVSTMATTSKSLIKLGYQISGSGQVASQAASGVTGVANIGGVVPGLKLVTAILGVIQNSYKLIRIGIRRSKVSTKMGTLMEKLAEVDYQVMSALETVHESLIKRTVRLGINLSHSITQIVAAGFDLSGLGAAGGMVISLASTTAKIGQTAARKGKQWLRDYWARRREEQGNDESFQDFKHRKRVAAAEQGRGAQIKTAIKLGLAINWDKSSSKKAATTRETAFEILNLNDNEIFDALGVTANLSAEESMAKKIDIIENALKKRD